MVGFRSDATGRSSTRVRAGRAKHRPPLEVPFIHLPMSLMLSRGFRALGAPARHVLDFIMVEHMRHGGTENGRLLATHLQLEKWGVSGRDISPALEMLDAFGLIKRIRAGKRLGGKDGATLYALTWCQIDDELPTDDFKTVTAAFVDAYLADAARLRKLKRAAKAIAEIEALGEDNRLHPPIV